mmetsp:Transcript_6586/g.20760  ORF Transcript_6586/g.20760 Transcript_6586/m.20760 type:complete len:131 (-) Transcript_6586:8-400(-)
MRNLLTKVACIAAMGSAFQAPPSLLSPRQWSRRRMSAAVESIEVCQNKHCRKRGAAATLKHFDMLVDACGLDVRVGKADCSDTEHGCFDECTMGPNVRVDGGRGITNGVRGAAAAADVLGIELPDVWPPE